MLIILSLTQENLCWFNSASVSSPWTTCPCSSVAVNFPYSLHLPVFVSGTSAVLRLFSDISVPAYPSLPTVPLANQCTPTEKLLAAAAKQFSWKGLALNVSSCILPQIHLHLEGNQIVPPSILKTGYSWSHPYPLQTISVLIRKTFIFTQCDTNLERRN